MQLSVFFKLIDPCCFQAVRSLKISAIPKLSLVQSQEHHVVIT